MASMFGESLRAFLRPVLEYLDDPEVSEIMINGPDDVWVERHGCLERTPVRFTEDGLLAACRNMAQYVGRTLTDEQPRLDARLPDGSRIHVILPPMARCGAVVSIRKFHPGGLQIDDLVRFGTITIEAARFLETAVLMKKNCMVAGGTGSGKTTLLNVLSHFIPNNERILTIEDSAELQLTQEHLVSLEARPADRHGRHAVTIRDLLHSALRLRPDRIVIGEVRGGECFDLLQAMNTGHGGMLSTCHANSGLETLSRLESLALLADVGLPLRAVRAQVASAIDLVVCTGRMRDGRRCLTSISEVLPLDQAGDYRVQDLFVFTQTKSERRGAVQGYLSPTGVLPTFQSQMVADGFADLTAEFFDPATYNYPPPAHFVGQRRESEPPRSHKATEHEAARSHKATEHEAAAPRMQSKPQHRPPATEVGSDVRNRRLASEEGHRRPPSSSQPVIEGGGERRWHPPDNGDRERSGRRGAGQYSRGYEPRPRRQAPQPPVPEGRQDEIRGPEVMTSPDLDLQQLYGISSREGTLARIADGTLKDGDLEEDPFADEGEPTKARLRPKPK